MRCPETSERCTAFLDRRIENQGCLTVTKPEASHLSGQHADSGDPPDRCEEIQVRRSESNGGFRQFPQSLETGGGILPKKPG